MQELARKTEFLVQKFGELVSWLNLVMVLVTLLIVFLRYVVGVGWVWMQEIVVYAHAFLFMSAIAYVLKKNAHVRVDLFYQKFSLKTRLLVNRLGIVFLLLPTCTLILWVATPYVLDSWRVFEGSKDGGGLEAVFLLKSVMILSMVLILVQAFSSFVLGMSAGDESDG